MKAEKEKIEIKDSELKKGMKELEIVQNKFKEELEAGEGKLKAKQS